MIEVHAIKLTGLSGHAARQIRQAHNGNPLVTIDGARSSYLAVTPLLGGHINNNRTRFHQFHRVFSHQQRGFFPRNERSRDDDIYLFGLLGKQGHLRFNKFLAHRFGVAAGASAIFLKLQL